MPSTSKINAEEEDEVFAELKATAGAPLKSKPKPNNEDDLKKRDEKALQKQQIALKIIESVEIKGKLVEDNLGGSESTLTQNSMIEWMSSQM